ncbi:MAG: conjugal transfer protein TraO [Bacteroidota bacterium]
MKENENKKTVVRVTEGNPSSTTDVLQDSTQNKADKLKKPLIFGLMGIVFVGCMYLIFKPSEDKKEIENIGLNDAVPQATGAGMQADKQKAYEQEMLDQKDAEKRNSLTTLSDYWNTNDREDPTDELIDEQESYANKNTGRYGNPTVNSYRNAQSTLGSFYQDDNESINRGNVMLYDGAKIVSEDNFVYGAGGRLTLETYLSDRFVLVLQGRTKVLWGTDLRQFRPSAGVGLRFNF